MKRALLVCCIGVLAPLEAVVSQSTPPEQSASWGIMAGGDFSHLQNSMPSSGGVIGVLAQFPTASSHFAIRIDAMFHYLAEKCGFDVICGPQTPGSVSAGVVARLNDSSKPWSPYAIAGYAGFLNENWTFGFAGGGGFEVRAAEHTYFVEARYMKVNGGGLVPITIGIRF
jgi:hypothetical protein